MSIQTVNPNTNKDVKSFEEMTEKTLEWAVVGRMNNKGHCCEASKRFIAVEAITDEFIQKFGNNFFKMKKGAPMNPTKMLGPLSCEAAVFQLTDQVKSSVDEGEKVLSGGQRAGCEGAFIEPVLTGLKLCIAAYYEEFFGAVASFYVVKNKHAAVGLANDSDFGLGHPLLRKKLNAEKK